MEILLRDADIQSSSSSGLACAQISTNESTCVNWKETMAIYMTQTLFQSLPDGLQLLVMTSQDFRPHAHPQRLIHDERSIYNKKLRRLLARLQDLEHEGETQDARQHKIKYKDLDLSEVKTNQGQRPRYQYLSRNNKVIDQDQKITSMPNGLKSTKLTKNTRLQDSKMSPRRIHNLNAHPLEGDC
ncbi:hypothetical protein Tco_1315138 [Tanacetum coccineum]